MSAVMPRLGRRDALMPRRPEGMGRGLMLAIAVHIGLVIALAIGVHWRSREPETMAAELWSAVPQVAAPRAVEPEPPKPQPAPPKPQPAPPKVETPAPAQQQQQQQRDADIAIEKARRAKEEEAHRAQEEAHRAREERRREQEEAKARAAEKAAAEKAARERQQQAEAEARRKQQQAEAEAKKKQELQEKKEAAVRADLRQKQLDRMMGQANATGDARSTGRAQQSSGPSASYAGRIRAAVRPNIVFNDDLSGNPVAEVEVRLASDGSILGTPRLTRSSGSKAWDDAVIRALVKTETLPRDVDGSVPPSMVIAFRPRE